MFKPKDFMFEPGEALIYNNNAYYFFLGSLKISGLPYENYLQDIFLSLWDEKYIFGSNTKVTKTK
jgi:hypothetical protein